MTSLNEFFRDGFAVAEPLPALIYHRYRALINETRFEREGDDLTLTADWESDLPSDNEAIPPPYLELMKWVAEQSSIAQWMQIRFGDFSRINVMLQKSIPGHDMDWHFDGFDPMHLVCLIYFTEREWTPYEGGQLLIGQGDCNDQGFILNQETVSLVKAISPAPGRVVWTLNTDPRKVHKVSKVLCENDERIVLIGQFGYQENAKATQVKQWLPSWE